TLAHQSVTFRPGNWKPKRGSPVTIVNKRKKEGGGASPNFEGKAAGSQNAGPNNGSDHRDRDCNIDPPTSSYAIMRRARPYRGENSEPGRDDHGELTLKPRTREHNRGQSRRCMDFVEDRVCPDRTCGPSSWRCNK